MRVLSKVSPRYLGTEHNSIWFTSEVRLKLKPGFLIVEDADTVLFVLSYNSQVWSFTANAAMPFQNI